MGVTVLQVYPDLSRSGVQEMEKLHKRILHLHAQQTGVFSVDCDTYYTTAQTGCGTTRKLHIAHNSEAPATTYAVLDTGNKQVTLSADIMFDLMLPRINHMYTAKKNLKIESKGAKFEISDFVVKMGNVYMSGHYKGILIEVEYLPCSVPALCWGLLREFMQSFMGSVVNNQAPPYLQNKFHDIHTPQDVIQQYVEKFNEIREGTAFTHTVQPTTTS